MNDQNNNNSSDQHDLNSILSSAPQAPNPSGSIVDNNSLGGGLMAPPIAETPPTPSATPAQGVDFTSNLTLNTPTYDPMTNPTPNNIPQGGAFNAPPPPTAPNPISLNPIAQGAPVAPAAPTPPPPAPASIPSVPTPPPASAAATIIPGPNTAPTSTPGIELSSLTPAPSAPEESATTLGGAADQPAIETAQPPPNPTNATANETAFNWPQTPPSPLSPASPPPGATPVNGSPIASANQSTFAPADLSSVGQSPLGAMPSSMPEQPPTMMQNDNAPTDLSHLVQPNELPTSSPISTSNSMPSSPYTPGVQQAESLVVPMGTAPQVGAAAGAAEVTTAKEGVPKWVIILGVTLLLIVAAASAYFILGIGRTTEEPTSAPATTQTQQITPPPTVAPTKAPIATSSAVQATSSAGFNSLNPSPQASSAADLLRSRQGR